ncbi:MAG: DUF3502 domain-containing protein [Eubacterium sp.]|nr:DUF3502 domain-containing protein [Eubacterium sp.]
MIKDSMRKKLYIAFIAIVVIILVVFCFFDSRNYRQSETFEEETEEEITLDFDATFSGSMCVVLRSDVGKALDIRERDLNTWENIETLLTDIKEAYPEYIPVMAGYDKAVIEMAADAENGVLYDTLSNELGILENPSESSEVTNYYETDSFRTMCEYMYKWRIRDLVGKNEILSTTGLVAEGYSAGFFSPNYTGLTQSASKCCGVNMSVYPIFTDIAVTGKEGDEKSSVSGEFSFDNTDVITEEAACNEVTDIYKWALLSGEINPDSGIDDFNNALYEAGIEKVIKSKQRQLRHYLRNS